MPEKRRKTRGGKRRKTRLMGILTLRIEEREKFVVHFCLTAHPELPEHLAKRIVLRIEIHEGVTDRPLGLHIVAISRSQITPDRNSKS